MNPFKHDSPVDIASFLIPMKPHSWLVPNVVVEQILLKPPVMHHVKKVESDKEVFIWHGYPIPVMYADDLLKQSLSDGEMHSRYSHMLIFHSTMDKSIFYFALVITALPKLIWIMPEDLIDLQEQALQPTESVLVQFHDQTLAIPNLAYLESKAAESIGRS